MKTPLSANLVALEPKTRSSSLFLFFERGIVICSLLLLLKLKVVL